MNHSGDANKMVSDTPRTDEVNKYLRTRDEYAKTDNQIWVNHARQLERELNAANDRIKRLEEAGDALKAAGYFGGWADAVNNWIKSKEAKP